MQPKVRQARSRVKKESIESSIQEKGVNADLAILDSINDKPPVLVCVNTNNFDVYIGNQTKNHAKTVLSCPIKLKPSNLYEGLGQYYNYAKDNEQVIAEIKKLGGKVLGCTCPDTVTCHGHVIIYLWKELMLPKLSSERSITWLDSHLNNPPVIEYIENWVENPVNTFDQLEQQVDFAMRTSTFGEKVLRDNRATAHYTRNLSEVDVSVHTETSTNIPPVLLELTERLERDYPEWEITRILCNRYSNGLQGIGWHSDREEIGHGPVFSISLGVEREKQFKLIQDENVLISKALQPGALVIMWPPCQQLFRHSIPKDITAFLPRINITLRTSRRK